MLAASFSISPQALWTLIGSAQAPQIVDVRRRGVHDTAVSLGLSALAGDDDHGLPRHGFMVYDALFAWLRFAAQERRNWLAKAA